MENKKIMKNTIKNEIGSRLKAARISAGFKSAGAFAATQNIPDTTYLQHESGKRSLKAEMILHYSKELKINPAWLLTGEGNPRAYCDGDLEQNNNSLTSQSKQVLIDLTLLAKILRKTIPIYADTRIKLSVDEFIDFCFDIYNNIVTTSANLKDQDVMIELSVNSLKRGANYNKNNKKEISELT